MRKETVNKLEINFKDLEKEITKYFKATAHTRSLLATMFLEATRFNRTTEIGSVRSFQVFTFNINKQ